MWYQILIATPLIAAGLELVFGFPGKVSVILMGATVLFSLVGVLKNIKRFDWKAWGQAAFFATLGAFATSLLAYQFDLGVVVASGLVGVVGGRLLPKHRQGQLYLGVFVGMSCINCCPWGVRLISTGVLGGLLGEVLKHTWSGVGGRLGTIAATSEIVTLLFSGYGW
ncbi:MAG TPA: hypothetical protein GX528_09195 [Firmicutes bacterium]|nr:hypothetical protein [Bacillota bacterium]